MVRQWKTEIPGRLTSLDVFRGITMFLLVAEGTGLYTALKDAVPDGSILNTLVVQFHHHEWNGLRFWDLVQPFFMFIVGVAMVYSLRKRWSRGDSWMDTFKHILLRCAILFAFGVVLHCGYRGKLVWELWNVLTQLSFTILIAFLIFKWPIGAQLGVSFGLILLTEILYRFFPVEGFNQPFVPDHNFGAWIDRILMGKLNPDHWVAVNCIPTAAHTIWGVLAGKILIGKRSDFKKIRLLALAGLSGVIVGYLFDIAGWTPIIKRICTSSFILVSGGWCLMTLAFFYWLVDVMEIRRWTLFFTVVGTNSIFIYLFSNTVGMQWLNDFILIFTGGFFGWIGIHRPGVLLINALIVLCLEWGVCYWLYKKKIFLRI